MATHILHDIHIRRYPPDQEADELATSASAYAAYERRPGQEGIDKIPHGFVSRQREIFSRQLILVEQQNESKSPSLSPLPPDTLRRKSAPTISVYVSKDNSISSTPNQTSSVSLEISPNRTSPSSISGNQSQVSGTNAKSPNQDHENVERQVHESVPSSSYLIWKSQEQIQKRRGSIPNQQSHSSGAESMESRPASQPEQTFRTIIMFPGKTTPTMTTPKKMSEIVEEKPKPHKVHPKSSEFLQNIKRTVSNASTASPETMLSPRTEDTSSPGSTPDLLKINSQQAENTQLSPATIRRNCERIMRIVQKYGCQIPEEEFDSFGESSSEASPEINSNMKSNFWSTHNFSKTDSIKHMSNQNPPEHGLHVEIPNFTKQNGFQNGHIENQMIKLKDEEIQRLQRELSDAHVCNQRLNSQLGVLASKESHITERELK
uniref:Uncharacterized protein n=2 Tax=Acrobeloides nanus TaxID=290746 RepID=A0A914E8T2_9BILA